MTKSEAIVAMVTGHMVSIENSKVIRYYSDNAFKCYDTNGIRYFDVNNISPLGEYSIIKYEDLPKEVRQLI